MDPEGRARLGRPQAVAHTDPEAVADPHPVGHPDRPPAEPHPVGHLDAHAVGHAHPSATSTPTPSATPSATTPAPTTGWQPPPAAGTTSSVAGRPDRDNTGVPRGTALRRVDGDITVRTSGTVLSGLDIHGFVNIKANNVVIKNSVVRGGVATGNTGLISSTWGYTGLVVQDSTIYPEHPSVWEDGVKGGGFTLRRVNIWGTVDNVKVHGSNVRVEDSYLHGTVKYASDPNQHGGPTHNDAVQILGGDNIVITGNTLVDGDNSAIQVTQNFAPVTRSVISNNYANNGGCTFNVWITQGADTHGLSVLNNRFGRTSRVSSCPIIANSASYLVTGGNVWDDNSSAVTIRKG